MAVSKEPGGLYFDSTRKVMVNSEGVEVKGADKPDADTPADKQPGAMGALTPEQTLANAIAAAMKGPAKAVPAASHDEPAKSGAKKK